MKGLPRRRRKETATYLQKKGVPEEPSHKKKNNSQIPQEKFTEGKEETVQSLTLRGGGQCP